MCSTMVRRRWFPSVLFGLVLGTYLFVFFIGTSWGLRPFLFPVLPYYAIYLILLHLPGIKVVSRQASHAVKSPCVHQIDSPDGVYCHLTPFAVGVAYAIYHSVVMCGILIWAVRGPSDDVFSRIIWMSVLDWPLFIVYWPFMCVVRGDWVWGLPVIIGTVAAYFIGRKLKEWQLAGVPSEKPIREDGQGVGG